MQIIPHAFGFRRPPVLRSLQAVNAKVEMCNVLSDIEIAQSMLAKGEGSEQGQQKQVRPWHCHVDVWTAQCADPVSACRPTCNHTTGLCAPSSGSMSPRQVRSSLRMTQATLLWLQDHPADENYRLLDADLQLLSTTDPELPVIQQYIAATVGRWQVKFANVWRVRPCIHWSAQLVMAC